MQFQLKRAVTAGSERFHDSLDELETEIRTAQAVLRRDLAQLRAERKQKEQAVKEKEVEKARLAAEPKHLPPPVKEEVASPPAPAPAPAPARPATATATATAIATPTPHTVKSEPVPVKVEPAPEKAPTPKVPTPPADTSLAHADNMDMAQDSEFDFDAMFGDSAMDTSADQTNDHAQLNLDAGADLNFTIDDQPDQPDQPDLLRGLEDFAKSGTDSDNPAPNNTSANLDLDFNMTDMPDLNANPPPEQPTTTKPVEETTNQQPTTTDELNLDTMTTDNLDDLFDLDDYENPEATQFDDAFFGFGES